MIMWGTTSPSAKLADDSGNAFEALLIGDCRLFRSSARNQPPRLLGLFDETRGTYRPHGRQRDAPRRIATCHYATLRGTTSSLRNAHWGHPAVLAHLGQTVILKRL